MYVDARFTLDPIVAWNLRQQTPDFGYDGVGEVTYYRTYSRRIEDAFTGLERQETWADTCIRVAQGVFSIRKDWYQKHGILWDEEEWQEYAEGFVQDLFAMHFLAPGRGLWVMGTDYLYERGSFSLNNCGYTEVTKLSKDADWLMDALMCGIGVGFNAEPRYTIELKAPEGNPLTYVIPDSREGWVESVRRRIDSWEKGSRPVVFDYSLIRPAGSPIKGFGGTASGPAPLKLLHERLDQFLATHHASRNSFYLDKPYTDVRLVADVMNAIGACVVAGNVRRSAEIALGSVHDPVFRDLKNWIINPDRSAWMGMSNNSVVLREDEDFLKLPQIARRIVENGEPGFLNMANIKQFGRLYDRDVKPDNATGCNPCVTGETMVLTRSGHRMIRSLVDASWEIWNGKEWSRVTPRVTGENQPVLRIALSNGAELTTTPYHGFMLSAGYGAKQPVKIEAKDLKIGDKLWKYTMPLVEGGKEIAVDVAYTHGLYCADGHFDTARERNRMWLYGPKQALLSHLRCSVVHEDATRDRTLVDVTGNLEPRHASKNYVPSYWSIDARLALLAGLIDGDGTLLVDGQVQIGSINRPFLDQIRLLLTTLGVQAKVRLMKPAAQKLMPDGQGGMKSYACKDCFRLLINAMDIVRLRELGLAPKRIDLSDVNPNRDASQFITVEAIEDAGIAERVYCFTDPLNGTGAFNGIVTANCGEIPLADKELCNLAECFPTRCPDHSSLLQAFEYAAFYASTVSLLPTHRPETNKIVAKNRRIGVSISGVTAWLARETQPGHNGMSAMIRTMREGYKIVKETNRALNEEAGVVPAIRCTTVKPSGSISLLAGVPAGVHNPEYTYWAKNMRVGIDNAMVRSVLDQAGVPHWPAHVEDRTMIYRFPMQAGTRDVGSGATIYPPVVSEVTLEQQYMLVEAMYRHWADNMVSVTLKFKKSRLPEPEEFGEVDKAGILIDAAARTAYLAFCEPIIQADTRRIEEFLGKAAGNLKSASLMPIFEIELNEDGSMSESAMSVYKDLPEEPLSKSQYDALKTQIRPFDWSAFSGDGEDTKFCDGVSCEVVFEPVLN